MKLDQYRTEHTQIHLTDKEMAKVAIETIRRIYRMDTRHLDGTQLMVYSYTHGHNGDEVYVAADSTVEERREFRQAQSLIEKIETWSNGVD